MIQALAVLLGFVFLIFLGFIHFAPGMISAGHWSVFFRFGSTGAGVVVPLAVLIAFTALAYLSLLLNRSVRSAVLSLLHDRRRAVWALVAIGVWILTMVPLDSAREPRYSSSQTYYVQLLFGSLAVLFLLYGLGRSLDFAGRLGDRCYQALLRMPRRTLLIAGAGFVFVVTNLISWLVFNHIPHIQDSVAQVFQARLFALGKLFVASPAYPQFFDLGTMINNGRWYCQYPFGHPLLLALGVLVGAPWIVNPVLGALTVVVIYYLGREVYDENTARIGFVLAVFSPFLLLMSSEYMSHASSLLLATVFGLCYARAFREPGQNPNAMTVGAAPEPKSLSGTGQASTSRQQSARLVSAVLAGLALGMVINIRPFTGLLIAVPFAIDALARLLRNGRAEWRPVAVMLGAGAVTASLLLIYNYLTNGDPFTLGYTVRWGIGHGLGFSQAGWREGYTLARRLTEHSVEMYALNRYLFEFPIPSLVFIVLLFATGTRKRWDWLLIGTAFSLTAGYFLHWWHLLSFGPRWQYEALAGLVLLTARGMRRLPDFLAAAPTPVTRGAARRRLGKLLIICYLVVFAIGLPSRLVSYARTGLGTSATTIKTIRRAAVHNAIVFNHKYEETFLYNSIPPAGDIIYAKDLGGANPLLTRQFPGRDCYLVKRESLFKLDLSDYEQSPLRVGMDSIVALLERVRPSKFKTLLWPAEELRDMIEPLAQRQGIPVHTYREMGQLLKGDADKVADYLPALAVWIVGDRSDGMVLFTQMDRRASQTVGGYQFQYINTVANGTVTLFGIWRTSPGKR